MNLIQELKVVLDRYWWRVVTQKYAMFDGRARRKEYWMFVLFQAAIGILVSLFCALLTYITSMSYWGLLYWVFSLATLLPGLAVTVRRLHDRGRSGWFVLIAFIPFVGLALIVMLAMDGEARANAYGANPKGSGHRPDPLHEAA